MKTSLEPSDTELPIIDPHDQLKVINAFFKCKAVHELLEDINAAEESFISALRFGPPRDFAAIIHREQLLGEDRIRDHFRSALFGMRDELRETIANQTNSDEA